MLTWILTTSTWLTMLSGYLFRLYSFSPSSSDGFVVERKRLVKRQRFRLSEFRTQEPASPHLHSQISPLILNTQDSMASRVSLNMEDMEDSTDMVCPANLRHHLTAKKTRTPTTPTPILLQPRLEASSSLQLMTKPWNSLETSKSNCSGL